MTVFVALSSTARLFRQVLEGGGQVGDVRDIGEGAHPARSGVWNAGSGATVAALCV